MKSQLAHPHTTNNFHKKETFGSLFCFVHKKLSILIRVIFLKSILKKALIIFLSGAIFFGAAYAYLQHSFNETAKRAEQKDYTVPYERLPENCGIAFVFPEGSALLAYLDFEESSIKLLDLPDFQVQTEYFGYTADYTVQVSYELIGGIIDRIGGISIEYGGETLRYTGVQVVDLIADGSVKDLKKQIILQIFNGISKNNFSKDDFVYIIENSKSNLSIIDCIYWLDYIGDMCNRISFVN